MRERCSERENSDLRVRGERKRETKREREIETKENELSHSRQSCTDCRDKSVTA